MENEFKPGDLVYILQDSFEDPTIKGFYAIVYKFSFSNEVMLIKIQNHPNFTKDQYYMIWIDSIRKTSKEEELLYGK